MRVCGKCVVLPHWWLARNAQAGPRKQKPQQRRKRTTAKKTNNTDSTVDTAAGRLRKSARARKRGSNTRVTARQRNPRHNKRRKPAEGPCAAPARGQRFPHPVGTRIASDFKHHGIFEGKILKLYPDTPGICYVEYTDGDGQDLDVEEIEYAISFYEREYGRGSA